MSVDVTYCLDEWENYFTEKPLSFSEFVDTYDGKEQIFPHIMEKIQEISKNHIATEYYIQGIIGSGKTTLIYLLAAYKVYLFLLLKSPSSLFNLSPTSEYVMAVFGGSSRKTGSLFAEGFSHFLSKIPFFRYASDNFSELDSAWTRNALNDVITFKHNGNELHCRMFVNDADLLGNNVVIGIMTELSFYQEACNISSEMIFRIFNKLRWRIDSRCKGNFISLLIVEKSPNNIWGDLMDKYFYENVINNPKQMLITFQRYWVIFKNKDPSADIDSYINIYTGEVSSNLLNNFDYIGFPSKFNGIDFLEKAKGCPEEFIKDYVGIPLQLGMNKKSYEVMKQIKDLMYKYNIDITYKHGKMYLECDTDQASLCLSDVPYGIDN